MWLKTAEASVQYVQFPVIECCRKWVLIMKEVCCLRKPCRPWECCDEKPRLEEADGAAHLRVISFSGPHSHLYYFCTVIISLVEMLLCMLGLFSSGSDLCVYLSSGPPPTLAVARLSHTGPSWADRVKSSQSLPVPSQVNNYPAEKPGKQSHRMKFRGCAI